MNERIVNLLDILYQYVENDEIIDHDLLKEIEEVTQTLVEEVDE